MIGDNQKISPDELRQIRLMSDFDLIMLLSEIHDHGWIVARELLPMIAQSEKTEPRQ